MRTRIAVAVVAAALASGTACAQQAYPDVTFSGFGTLGAVRTDSDAGRYATSVLQPGGARDSWDVRTDSLIAGQVNARFTPQLSFVGQAVANRNAEDDFMPHAEWAFLRYAVTPELALRGGALAVPVFMLSDSRLVGLSFPWVRPPTALYSQAPITNFRGVDLTWQRSVGDATFTVQPYLGKAPTKVPSSTGGPVVLAHLDRMAGISASAELHAWTVRAGYFRSRFTYHSGTTDALFAGLAQVAPLVPAAGDLASQLSAVDKNLSFASVGIAYDGPRAFFQAEYGRRKADFFLANTNAWYASFGYRFGNIMPHVTVSSVDVTSRTSQNVIPPLPALAALAAGVNSLLAGQNIAQDTVAVGMRWQFAPSADLKVQWDRVRLPNGAVGNFIGTPGFADRVNVYSAAVDFVF
jgi:hypothetical protein